MKRIIVLALLCVFLLSLFLGSLNLTFGNDISISVATFYDFVANAGSASWSSGAGALPWPGTLDDPKGFALYRAQIKLEDNQVYGKVLETHPQWVDTGWIQGIYPQLTVPSNAKLNIKVGFISGATASDGVIFRVIFRQGQTSQTLIEQRSYYDGHLDAVSYDLSPIAGKTGNFILYVNALKGSGQDWAIWTSATIDQTMPSLPDLTVKNIYCSSDNRITVDIANIGSAPLPSGYFGKFEVYVDGTYAGWFDLSTVPTYSTGGGIAVPGGISTYIVVIKITKTSTVKVIVDSANNIAESNESNNTLTLTISPCVFPDLLVTEISCNYDRKTVEFTIKNNGKAKTDKPFNVALYVNGTLIEKKKITETIEPMNSYSSKFDTYILECTNVKIKIFADVDNEIAENNETNNAIEKECKCEGKDTTPPKITKGPDISQITQTTAMIAWETDEESNSKVYYGTQSMKPDSSKEEKIFTKKHSITLTGLLPATTYMLTVESKDSSGNAVQSKEKLFETLPEEDKEKPSISLILPERISGRARITAEANDNKGIDRVAFYLDGKLMFTDCSVPFEWDIPTHEIPDGDHSFSATAFDLAGNKAEVIRMTKVLNRFPVDNSPVRVRIEQPASLSEVYGNVHIEASVYSGTGSCIKRTEVWINDTLVYSDTTNICLHPMWCGSGCPDYSSVNIDYYWQTVGIALGNYSIVVKAWDEYDNEGKASIVVRKVIEPELTLHLTFSRNVIRRDNYFIVELSITNNEPRSSDHTVYNFTVRDRCFGFQPANEPGLTISNGTEGYNHTIIKNFYSIIPGETKTLSYAVVPVLYEPMAFIRFESYSIGDPLINVSYDDIYGRSYTYSYPVQVYSSAHEVSNAFASSDYLILTSPANLYSFYDDAEVDTLLSTMAELAKVKRGVLGYLPSGMSSVNISFLLYGRPNRWGQFLNASMEFPCFSGCRTDWETSGYLLIVGETKIVPSFTLPTPYYNEDNGGFIRCSDYPYIGLGIGCRVQVGRIVGDSAVTLTKPIRASIDVYNRKPEHVFDRSHALLVAGDEGTWEQFIYEIGQLAEILRSQGTSTHLNLDREYNTTIVNLLREALVIRGDFQCIGAPGHLKDDGVLCPKTHPPMDQGTLLRLISIDQAIAVEEDRRYGEPLSHYNYSFGGWKDAWDSGTRAIAAGMPNKDIFILNGHGGPGEYTEFKTSNFGNHHPLIFINSCSTGAYEDISGNPECSFNCGAAVYIGATEVAPADLEHGFEFQKKFFNEYWTPGVRCGDAFTDLKQWAKLTGDGYFLYMAEEYNLYGDPKFGGN